LKSGDVDGYEAQTQDTKTKHDIDT